ncbi:MAG: hypothetical protein ACP5UT_17830 [Bryobacteraceae bacterium]
MLVPVSRQDSDGHSVPERRLGDRRVLTDLAEQDHSGEFAQRGSTKNSILLLHARPPAAFDEATALLA